MTAPADVAVIWAVSWTHNGARYAIDVDDEATARRLALEVVESGRLGVMVTHHEMEIDPDLRQRIEARLEERLRALKSAQRIVERTDDGR